MYGPLSAPSYLPLYLSTSPSPPQVAGRVDALEGQHSRAASKADELARALEEWRGEAAAQAEAARAEARRLAEDLTARVGQGKAVDRGWDVACKLEARVEGEVSPLVLPLLFPESASPWNMSVPLTPPTPHHTAPPAAPHRPALPQVVRDTDSRLQAALAPVRAASAAATEELAAARGQLAGQGAELAAVKAQAAGQGADLAALKTTAAGMGTELAAARQAAESAAEALRAEVAAEAAERRRSLAELKRWFDANQVDAKVAEEALRLELQVLGSSMDQRLAAAAAEGERARRAAAAELRGELEAVGGLVAVHGEVFVDVRRKLSSLEQRAKTGEANLANAVEELGERLEAAGSRCGVGRCGGGRQGRCREGKKGGGCKLMLRRGEVLLRLTPFSHQPPCPLPHLTSLRSFSLVMV